jgi:hypothetical protein
MVTFLARIRKEYYHGLKYQKMKKYQLKKSAPHTAETRLFPPLDYFLIIYYSPIAKDGRCWFWLCEAQSCFNW